MSLSHIGKKGVKSFLGKRHSQKTKSKISIANSKPKIKIVCKNCSKDFYVVASKSKRRSCCSKNCRNEYQKIIFKGSGNINWKGGKRLRPDGYVECFVEGNKRLYQLEHRLAMEKIVGRKLKRSEDVHHLNGIKNDNRKENLLLILKSEHTKLHNNEKI